MSEFVSPDNYYFDPEAEIPERLFHSTTYEDERKILAKGLKIDCSRQDLDFGLGFYTTRDPRQGFDWAINRQGVRMTFVVDSTLWEMLDVRRFHDDQEWIVFVRECICNRPTESLGDVVEGKVCSNPDLVRRRGADPKGFGTQTVFKTAHSTACLHLDAEDTLELSSARIIT